MEKHYGALWALQHPSSIVLCKRLSQCSLLFLRALNLRFTIIHLFGSILYVNP